MTSEIATSPPPSLLATYERSVEKGDIFSDPVQRDVIEALQRLADKLHRRWARPRFRWWQLQRRFPVSLEDSKGLYLWGGVGRGKTYLMDLFFDSLASERKLRMHFHRFMGMVHKGLGRHKGSADPLRKVALDIVASTDVICFDEFFVSDIADAMILANLLETLFAEGVMLVATSNIVPDGLYENGLQRQMFVPAIALLNKHTLVLNLDSGIDYRLRNLEQATVYHCPLNAEAEEALGRIFNSLSQGQSRQNQELDILGREIKVAHLSEGLAWIEFSELCEGPRSAADYIELAQLYHTVILGNVPVLTAEYDAAARRFISLIDEFYDHNVKLIVSAAALPQLLYKGTELAFAFDRTVSRLLEMQSLEYLGRAHKA